MIYFLQAPDGLTKIGVARDAVRRVAAIMCMSPVPLTVLAIIDGDEGDEAALHERHREHRRHGEWFALPESVATTVRSMTPKRLRAQLAAAAAPRRMGRPPDDEAKREVKVQIRAMATQRAAWHAAAALAGKDLSEWLRDLADEAARRAR